MSQCRAVEGACTCLSMSTWSHHGQCACCPLCTSRACLWAYLPRQGVTPTVYILSPHVPGQKGHVCPHGSLCWSGLPWISAGSHPLGSSATRQCIQWRRLAFPTQSRTQESTGTWCSDNWVKITKEGPHAWVWLKLHSFLSNFVCLGTPALWLGEAGHRSLPFYWEWF